MEHSPFDWQMEQRRTVSMGPAVSPRRRGAAASGAAMLAEPLPPFVRPGRAALVLASSAPRASWREEEPLGAMLRTPVSAETEGEDDRGPLPGEDPGLAEAEELRVETTDLLWAEAPPPAPPAEPFRAPPAPGRRGVIPEPRTTAPPLESVTLEGLDDWSLAAPAAPEPAVAPQTMPAPRGEVRPAETQAAALAAAMDLGEGPALQEVAGRLERIATALREGRPVELFSSGASDPLEVLIAGYALGYSEAFRRVGEERRRGL